MNNIGKSLLYFFVFTLVIVFQSNTARALSISPNMDLDIVASVSNPKPNQQITLTAKSYTIDINASSVTWSVNGKVVEKGIGLTSYQIKVPESGKVYNVNVIATAPNGRTVSNSLKIAPIDIDLIVETDGYTPSMFMGKINPSFQNKIKIITIPHMINSNGKEYDPKSLIYRWKKDSKVLESDSGYGKQSIIIQDTVLSSPFTATVDVSTRDGKVQGSASINIEQTDPFVEFYVDDPLYGTMYNKAIKNKISIGEQKETSIKTALFGFNRSNKSKQPELKWYINGTERKDLGSVEYITLRTPEEAGLANIKLEVRNMDFIRQGAQSGFETIFMKPTNNRTPTSFQ